MDHLIEAIESKQNPSVVGLLVFHRLDALD